MMSCEETTLVGVCLKRWSDCISLVSEFWRYHTVYVNLRQVYGSRLVPLYDGIGRLRYVEKFSMLFLLSNTIS